MIRKELDRLLFIDQQAKDHDLWIHAVEVSAENALCQFITIYTKGMDRGFEETEHDPNTFHRGDEKQSWVNEVWPRMKLEGWHQHFHKRTGSTPTLADFEQYRKGMSAGLWQELEEHIGA